MVILKYELKRHRKYILGWAIALALCVFVMTPTYYSFMDVSTGDLYETLGTSDFYKGVGVSMEYLTSPLGIYAFLTSFFMIASGIFGMHFGIAIHTKECSERTSEYLFTKPHTRKTIYWAKAFTVFFGVVVVSMVYLLASFLALALFRSGMNIGQDAMGTMANTLILAFAGSSLNTLLLFQIFDYPMIQIFNADSIAIEIIRGVAGTIGIILTVPLVALLSAEIMGPKKNA